MLYSVAPTCMSSFIPRTSLQNGGVCENLGSNPSSDAYLLCDLVELTYPLCALVYPSVKGEGINSSCFISQSLLKRSRLPTHPPVAP